MSGAVVIALVVTAIVVVSIRRRKKIRDNMRMNMKVGPRSRMNMKVGLRSISSLLNLEFKIQLDQLTPGQTVSRLNLHWLPGFALISRTPFLKQTFPSISKSSRASNTSLTYVITHR